MLFHVIWSVFFSFLLFVKKFNTSNVTAKLHSNGQTTKELIDALLDPYSHQERFASNSTRSHSKNEVPLPQTFRDEPRDFTVYEGENFTLNCAVNNLQGDLQWVKDGFALGFRAIFSGGVLRYQYVGDHEAGEFHLSIINASLADSGVYQCQVTPTAGSPGIRSYRANVNVVVPPRPFEIKNHTEHEKIELKNGGRVFLECQAVNATPPADLFWYRNSKRIEPNDRFVIENHRMDYNVSFQFSWAFRYTTVSKISFEATPKDDFATIACATDHAFYRGKIIKTDVQLSVLYPPGNPIVEGYKPGDVIRNGQDVELKCKSRGGNPAAQITWLKNGEEIKMAYKTIFRVSENLVAFRATPADNKANFTCLAKNSMIAKPLRTNLQVNVIYSPESVTINGPSEGRIGDKLDLTCVSAPSNPTSNLRWVLDGRNHPGIGDQTVVSTNDGYVSQLNTSVTVAPNRRVMSVVCHASNPALADNIIGTHNINVLYPPSVPLISGFDPSVTLVSGNMHKLSCMSTGGNPLATVNWYKNDKKLNAITKMTENAVMSEVSILLNVSDNQAQYRCEASNSATDYPLAETITMAVHFPPENVKVQVVPEILTPGVEATLKCDSSSSNPPAELSWWKNGIPVTSGQMQYKKGLHGGMVSTIDLKLPITKDLNRAEFICQATNEVLGRSVHDGVKLNVLYPPAFTPQNQLQYVAIEDQSFVIQLEADGNPDKMNYTWTKSGLPITQEITSNKKDRMIANGGMVNITRVSRNDAGVYTCEAINSQGAATMNVTLNVQYEATIVHLAQNGISNPEGDAMLGCTVTGNPLSAEHIHWERKGYDIASKITHFDPKNGTSYLYIDRVTKDDMGYFNCVVDNGVGVKTSQEVMLLVKFKPEVDTSPHLAKFGANVGETGKLKCVAKSVPAPKFTWSRKGVTLPVNASTKYFMEQHRTDALTYVSNLMIKGLKSADYGPYDCDVMNELGSDGHTVQLDITSAPESVVSMRVTNVTHNSVSLEWTPGFDGGLPAWYRVRYRDIYESSYKYTDVSPKNATQYTVRGLDSGIDYVFSVMSINDIGQSKYRPDEISTATLTSPEVEEMSVVTTRVAESDHSHSVIMYVSIVGAILVVANAAFLACFLLKRRARRLKEHQGRGSSKAIEMYAASPYNEGGDTLSSVSEKSESYSHEGPSIDDIVRLGERPPIPEVPSRHFVGTQQADMYSVEDALAIPPPMDYPPPNYAYEGDHARTLPHPHRNKDLSGHSTLGRNGGAFKTHYVQAPSPLPPLDGSYYNSTDKYLSYPPIISDYLQQQQPSIPAPPHPYGVTPLQNQMLNIGTGSPHHAHTYEVDVTMERQSNGGTLRRQRLEKMAVPPPDVTVLHPGSCVQHMTPAPVKQPQSILKDPSRHKYGTPVSSSTPHNSNSSQILAVQNLTPDIPQYGTIRKENKRQNVTIDDGYGKRNETHVV